MLRPDLVIAQHNILVKSGAIEEKHSFSGLLTYSHEVQLKNTCAHSVSFFKFEWALVTHKYLIF